jgi:biotin carboxylase
MPHVLFVAPKLLENTNRYIKAFSDLPGVKLSVVTEDPDTSVPPSIRPKLAAHYRVDSAQTSDDLVKAGRKIAKAVGPIDRLTGALEQLQMPMAEARDALGVEGMSAATARAFRDKDHMKDVLRAHGVPVAKSGLATSAAGLEKFVKDVGFPVIIKPQAGVGARETWRIESAADLRALAKKGVVPTAKRPLQIEEFVRAREHTCETVTVKGTPVWRSGTRYFPSPLEVLETPWVQYCVLLPREENDPTWTRFHPTNSKALAALFGSAAKTAAGTAITHMEWFLREDGSALVNEVGARPPGVLIMPLMTIAHEADMIAKWAELIAFDRFTPLQRRYAAGAAFFRGQGEGNKVKKVTGLDEAVAKVGPALVELRAPKVGAARGQGYEGEGWATVRSDSTDGAKHALRTLIETIQVRYG